MSQFELLTMIINGNRVGQQFSTLIRLSNPQTRLSHRSASACPRAACRFL